jgi:hypothetical protein
MLVRCFQYPVSSSRFLNKAGGFLSLNKEQSMPVQQLNPASHPAAAPETRYTITEDMMMRVQLVKGSLNLLSSLGLDAAGLTVKDKREALATVKFEDFADMMCLLGTQLGAVKESINQ